MEIKVRLMREMFLDEEGRMNRLIFSGEKQHNRKTRILYKMDDRDLTLINPSRSEM